MYRLAVILLCYCATGCVEIEQQITITGKNKGKFEIDGSIPTKVYKAAFGAGTKTTTASLMKAWFDPDIGSTVLGDFGPSEVVSGVVHLDRTQAVLEIAQIFRGRLFADQVLVKADLGWTHVDDMPGDGEAPLTSSDGNSWGSRHTC